jgi:PAS domain S-box-containing protein
MTKQRVWIVEDESIVAIDLKKRLQARGYDVLGISSYAEDAIEKVRQHKPDIVLMDIVLKGEMDGITASGVIKEEMRIPVVYLTAYADNQTIDRAKVTEPYGYIIKPYEESDVVTAIEIALYKASIERKLRESERWIRTMTKSMGEGIIATDTEGMVKFMNPVAELLTGVNEQKAILQPSSKIFSIEIEKAISEVIDPVDQALTDQDVISSDDDDRIVLIAQDGTRRYVEYVATPIHDDREKLTGAVLIFRDITERIRIEEMLRHVIPGKRETPLRDLLKEEIAKREQI